MSTQSVSAPPQSINPTAESVPKHLRNYQVLQPQTTHSGSEIEPIKQGLPRTTQSLCPECLKVIDATLYEEDGKVIMQKTCSEHGEVKDVAYSDARMYLKMEQWSFGDNRGLSNPAIPKATRCPEQCGICSMHTSHTGLANVDLTNRCNLTCPVCFANSNVAGYLYEPSIDQTRKMLQALRDERPVPCRVVQFSGGEPTLHPRFLDILSMASEMGFTHIQAATNGIKFLDLDFAKAAKEAGLHTLYLQFDGVCDDIYKRTRGASLWDMKMKCIENVRRAGLKIVFVPTIVKTVNDHQIGDIVRVAVENVDCVSGISFQPVSFTGRIARREREQKRFTMTDVARCLEEQTGLANRYEDWFPLSCVTPFSKLLSAIRGEEITQLSSNPHCSIGTYFFVSGDRKEAVPITQFIDVGSMLKEIDLMSRSVSASSFKFFTKVRVWQSLQRYFKPDKAPKGLTFTKFLQTLQGMTDKKYGRGEADGTFTYKTLMVAGMHFMDAYNYDVERVKRCIIHYAAPNGLIYPFCAYNSGPTYRDKIEKKYSVPLPPRAGKEVEA
ncbi:MAG: radical SAM protein [Acidobacteriia bacterium]|nr:radical SAM protein [Terriglobia bacterium]